MDRILNDSEMSILRTPIALLDKAQRQLAFQYRERLDAAIREENKAYGPISIGGMIVISDSLGHQGIRSQVDGMYYDSKSAYYKSLKSSGHIICDDGMVNAKREIRGDFDCKKELKEAWQSVKSKQPKKRKGRK